MNNDKELSIYELGIIKTSLRERLITVEEVRDYRVTEEDKERVNKDVDAFKLQLMEIKDKIEVMISSQLDERPSQILCNCHLD